MCVTGADQFTTLIGEVLVDQCAIADFLATGDGFAVFERNRVFRALEMLHVFRKTKPAPGTSGPLIPGDPEREAEAIRSKEGIPLLQPVVDDLLDISRKTGIPFEVEET